MSSEDAKEELASKMDEYATVPNYESIPCDAFRIPYLTQPLWRHQYQAIYCCLKAEAGAPIVTDAGEVFYSKSGLLPMPTGTGKTRMMLGVANFPVDERPVTHNISGTSLNLMMLNRKPRGNISTTILCSKREIITNAWIKDLKISYPGLPYFEFDTVGTFEKDALKSPEYARMSSYIDQICTFVQYWISQLQTGAKTQGEFEMAMLQIREEEISTAEQGDAFIRRKKEEKRDLQERIIKDRIVSILRSHKIVFISKDSFHFLFRVFKDFTVDRLVFDEPQDITLTKQDGFHEYLKDDRAKAIRSIGRIVPFYEESPARFIWYVSATPYDIPRNVKGHYVNGWVDRNDFVIADYISSTPENRMFPELVSRYVIKFPLSYILEQRPDLQRLIRKFRVKCRRTAETNIVRGLISSEIDNMLENDDLGAVINKLSVSGTATNILDASIERITFDINKLDAKIRAYDPNTPAHIITKSNEELDGMRKKLVDLQRKVNIYRGNHLSGEVQDCSICFESLNLAPIEGETADKRCVVHMGCMNVFHIGCLAMAMKKKHECPTCREAITKPDDIKPTYDQNGYTIQQQLYVDDQNETVAPQPVRDPLDPNYEHKTKLDAIKEILTTPKNLNGQIIPRTKVLLFINFKSDTGVNIDEIVRTIQRCGFSVRLPFTGYTIDSLAAKYPPIGQARVTMKKANSAISKEINEFRTTHERFVWIFRSGKESSGLNFPFADTSIQYSEFGRQVIGRTVRMDRVDPLDLITLYHIDGTAEDEH